MTLTQDMSPSTRPQLDEAPSLMQRLRDETSEAHQGAEAVPFNQHLVAERLAEAAYIGQLCAYLEVHRALEEALDRCDHPAVAAVWRDAQKKTHLLERDLDHFAGRPFHWDVVVEYATDSFVDAIETTARHNPAGLLGYLYVLEGSTMGGMVLQKHLRAGLGLERDGLAYYNAYGRETARNWKAFKQRMNDAPLDAAEQRRIIDCAKLCFAGIRSILVALSPPPEIRPRF